MNHQKVKAIKFKKDIWQRIEKYRLKRFLIVLLTTWLSILCNNLAEATSIGLGENWQIEHAGEVRNVPTLKGAAGRLFPRTQDAEGFIYRKTFSIQSDLNLADFSLILPANWATLKITLNDDKILDETTAGKTVGRIFAERVVHVPRNALKAENSIVIEASGHPLLLGFRSSAAQLTASKREVNIAAFKNSIFNDTHVLFIAISIAIAIASFWMSTFAPEKTGVLRHLALTNLGIIPHHLLATDIYKSFLNSPDLPFKLQMIFQLVTWTTLLPLLANLSERKIRVIDFLRGVYGKVPHAGKILLLSAALLIFLPFGLFSTVAFPLFSMICAGAFSYIWFLKKDTFGLLMTAGVFLCMTSLVSDVVFGNLYLLGHGTALFSVVSVSIISGTFKASFLHGRAFSELVRYSLPNSVHQRIHGFLSGGEEIGRIREHVGGNDILSIVLIDICDWGKMNDIRNSKIPHGLLKKSRNIAFARFERVAEDYSFDLLKTTGDNMMFVGGLFKADRSKQVILSHQTLQLIDSMLSAIDEINSDLRNANLPGIRIKIAASLGECEFGLELYNKRLQFDVQGHPVNSAYRIESSMDEDFYRKFGKNVAAVSSSVIYPCEDLSLRKRFPFVHKFTDKHGLEYECYVALQYEERLEVSDFAQALYGFYSHVNSKTDTTNGNTSKVMTSTDSKPSDNRISPRKKLYLNDGFGVSISKSGRTWEARALDLSCSGLAIAISQDSNFDPSFGEIVDLTINIETQQISLQAEVVSKSQLDSSQTTLQRFGLKFSMPPRNTIERQWKRFTTLRSAAPTVKIPDAIDARRSAVMTCVDISASGLGVYSESADLLLIPGMRRSLLFAVPGEEPISVAAEVKYVRKNADNSLRAGFEIIDNLDKMRECCGTYIVASERGRVSFSDVRNAGFSIAGIRRFLEVKYPEHKEEEEQIDSLRRLMLNESSLADGDAVDLRDPFDQFSRQIICKVGDRVVACVRVVFNDGLEERIEHISYGAEIPEFLFKEGFVECSRLIVHPEFRGDEILWTLMAEIGRVTLTSGHRYILQSCSTELSSLYERFGFKPCGTFEDCGKTWVLNILDIEAGIRGRTNNGVAWALVYSELNDIMQSRHNYKLDIVDRARRTILDKTRPIVLAKYRKVRTRYAKKKFDAAS